MLARSRAIDRLRSSAARRDHEERIQSGFDAPAPGASPEAMTAERERERRVLLAVAELPREQARAIELAFFEGLTHVEAERASASRSGP